MKRDPAISVVMPVYNCERFVAEALQSVLQQSWRDFECLILDDGSTDATLVTCSAVAEGDSRVRIISKPNTGLVDTLNYGLMSARAPIIARMDGDDICYPHRFEVQYHLLELARCIAISSAYIQIDEFGNELSLQLPPDIRAADPTRIPPREPYLPHPFMMFRRDEILSVGGYRHCVHSEDADLCWRLFDWAPLWNIPEALGRYRLHSGSVSSRSSANARVQAASAQLAAICHRRRREGADEIRFERSRSEVASQAERFETLIELYREQLSPEELEQLELGASLRFLDFARFRHYPIEVDDISFALRAVRRSKHLLGGADGWAEWVVQEACRSL